MEVVKVGDLKELELGGSNGANRQLVLQGHERRVGWGEDGNEAIGRDVGGVEL